MDSHNHVEQAKQVVDVLAGAGTVAAIMKWVPPITAVLTLIWVGLRIYESKTVQGIIARLRSNKS